MARSLLGAAALVLVLLAGAPALGQLPVNTSSNVDIFLPNQPAPILPGATFRTNTTLRYSWSGTLTSPNETTVTITVEEQPSWLNVTFEPTEVRVRPLDYADNGNNFATLVNLTLLVATDAPAFATAPVRVHVAASDNPPVQAAERDRVFNVTAGFLGLVEARLLDAPVNGTITVRGGFQQTVDVRVTNLGNGPLLVSVNATRSPAESKWQVVEVELGTEEADRSRVVAVPVRTPWRVTYKFPAEITVTPTHATAGVPGAPVVLAFDLRSESLVPIPDATAPLVAFALLGGALLARRKR